MEVYGFSLDFGVFGGGLKGDCIPIVLKESQSFL